MIYDRSHATRVMRGVGAPDSERLNGAERPPWRWMFVIEDLVTIVIIDSVHLRTRTRLLVHLQISTCPPSSRANRNDTK